MTLIEFYNHFRDEDVCKKYLKTIREKHRIVCQKCGCSHHYWKGYRSQWQCSRCGHRTSLTSGTVMHGTVGHVNMVVIPNLKAETIDQEVICYKFNRRYCDLFEQLMVASISYKSTFKHINYDGKEA